MPCHFIHSQCLTNLLQVLPVVIQSHTGFQWVPQWAIKNQKIRVLMLFFMLSLLTHTNSDWFNLKSTKVYITI